ncbi:Sortilin, partial [Desmophyllum pertusum]
MVERVGERLKFRLQISGPLLFHPHEENWILARAVVNGMAYLSKDFGVTWTFLAELCKELKMGCQNRRESGEGRKKTILMTVSTAIHVQHVYSFGLQGQFLFVSVDAQQ